MDGVTDVKSEFEKRAKEIESIEKANKERQRKNQESWERNARSQMVMRGSKSEDNPEQEKEFYPYVKMVAT